jgi:hypothetical protein
MAGRKRPFDWSRPRPKYRRLPMPPQRMPPRVYRPREHDHFDERAFLRQIHRVDNAADVITRSANFWHRRRRGRVWRQNMRYINRELRERALEDDMYEITGGHPGYGSRWE